MALITRNCDEELPRERPPGIYSKYSRHTALLVATLAAFSTGTYLSWTSSALPLYDNGNGTLFVISDQEASWIASLMPLGAATLTIPAGVLADRLGRKKTICAAAAVPLFLCWYVIGFARNKTWIFLARFAAGAACGATCVVVPRFREEIVERSVGATLVFQLQITAGILFAYATAFTDSPHVIAILCSVAPGVLLISFPFISESPAWLIAQGRRNETNDASKQLRGARYRAEELAGPENVQAGAGIADLRNCPREACITLGLMTLQQLSGVSSLIFNAKRIFDAAGSSSSTSSMIVGAAQVIATCFSIIVIERADRKILLFISTAIMSTCMFALSGYFRFQNSHDLSAVSWIPLVSFAGFIVVFSIGLGPIPWIMIGELFANDARKAASTATAVCNWTLAFLVTKCFQDMVDLVGLSSSFATFGVMCLIGTAFVAFMVPETKGRSLEEIQIELYGRETASRENR